jgi:hydroxymethylbilane synthase
MAALFSFHWRGSVFSYAGDIMPEKPIILCTRGSALALAQSNLIAAQCRAAFPGLQVELKIIKTTGDKLQKASMAKIEGGLPKGLFTKELEVALLEGQADLAVHSLKDLPTDLPAGLVLAATPRREDVRDVLIYRGAGTPAAGPATPRGFKPNLKLKDLPPGATIATSSTRRKMSLLAVRPDLNIVEIRGNVATRMQKVAARGELDATILALAGMTRLNFTISAAGALQGDAVPSGLLATVLDLKEMLPCVGQGAIGLETRADDPRLAEICARLNHPQTFHAVTAERAFLRGMGGGCQSPVGAYAQVTGGDVSLQAISFRDQQVKRGHARRPVAEAALLGEQIALELK